MLWTGGKRYETVAYKESIILSEIKKLKATKYLVEKSQQFIT